MMDIISMTDKSTNDAYTLATINEDVDARDKPGH